MLEKENQKERLDYLDGLTDDFKEYINETKVMNDNKKSERLSSGDNYSNESNNSLDHNTNKKIVKNFDKLNINQNEPKDSKEIIIAEKTSTINKKELNKSKKDIKNIEKGIKKSYNDLSDDIYGFQAEDFNEKYFDELYDVSKQNIELNPKYEEAQIYDDYINADEDPNDYDMINDDLEDNYNDIPRENFFMNKATNDYLKKDLI